MKTKTPSNPRGAGRPRVADSNFATPISDDDAKDIVHRLQWAIDRLKGARCECDLSVGCICETCGESQLLIDARNEIQNLKS